MVNRRLMARIQYQDLYAVNNRHNKLAIVHLTLSPVNCQLSHDIFLLLLPFKPMLLVKSNHFQTTSMHQKGSTDSHAFLSCSRITQKRKRYASCFSFCVGLSMKFTSTTSNNTVLVMDTAFYRNTAVSASGSDLLFDNVWVSPGVATPRNLGKQHITFRRCHWSGNVARAGSPSFRVRGHYARHQYAERIIVEDW